MAAPVSFIPVVERWCKKIEPRFILEWGPGYSTKLFAELCPHAKIVSIEHSKRWWSEWMEKIKRKNTRIILMEAPEDDRKDKRWDDYIHPWVKDMPEFDLIFVDGRERVRCLKYAKEVVSKDGVVILHDADRSEYEYGIQLFNVIDSEDGTVCLKPK